MGHDGSCCRDTLWVCSADVCGLPVLNRSDPQLHACWVICPADAALRRLNEVKAEVKPAVAMSQLDQSHGATSRQHMQKQPGKFPASVTAGEVMAATEGIAPAAKGQASVAGEAAAAAGRAAPAASQVMPLLSASDDQATNDGVD